MRFVHEFDTFLEKTVNLSPGRLSTLNKRVETIEKLIREQDSEPDLVVVGTRPQGSFAQGTIINPKDDVRGFDADLLVESEEHGLEPKELLRAVKSVVKASPHHVDLVHAKHRCVTLDYAGAFHLDVVPAVRQEPILYIANKETNGWEPTDPDGFNVWFEDHDESANGHLVPAIRLCKYLRDYKGRPKIKSVILSVLLAERVEQRFQSEFEDLATTLMLLLEDLATWAGQISAAPLLKEPSCDAELRLGDTNWTAFTSQIESLAKRARKAYDEEHKNRGLAQWRKLFGEKFPAPIQEARIAKAALDSGEQDLWRDFGIPTEISETVSIGGKVRAKPGFRGGLIALLRPLHKMRSLSFELADTSVVT